MNVDGATFIVTGGASGLGAATARALLDRGGNVAIADIAETSPDLDQRALYQQTDIRLESQVKTLIEATLERFGGVAGLINCAGVGVSARLLGREGPHPLDLFAGSIETNLVATFNMIRLGAAAISLRDPTSDGERGVIVTTASVAAFDGQVGQAAYAAAKGGIAAMTLPLARELARVGIRVVSIAPGLFATPMMEGLRPETRSTLEASVPFPQRLGWPSEFAALVIHVIENAMLNGETIRLDGALRLPAR